MGRTPEEYCDYWTSRFPKLLMHSWYSMHCVKNEHIFSRYFDKQYDFIQVNNLHFLFVYPMKLRTSFCFVQKYIIWPTPKPKTDFHRALETAFPIHDPLFPKKRVEPAHVAKLRKEDEVPDSWLEHVTEESKQTTDEDSDDKGVEEAQDNTSTSPSAQNRDSASASAETSLQERSGDDIVLGPGGHWGLQFDRCPLRVFGKDGDSLTPRVPAWSLPTLRQQWEFSEITHHGRKKQKSLNRKKKRTED